MPIDMGLLIAGALGSAAKEGVESYRDQTNKNKDRNLKNAMFALNARKEGYNFDPNQIGSDQSSAVDNQGLIKAQNDAASAIDQVRSPDDLKNGNGLLGADTSLPTPTLPMTTGRSNYDANGLMETPEHAMVRQLEAKKTQSQLSDYDPENPSTKVKMQFNKGLINQASPGLGDKIPEGMSLSDLENNQFLPEAIKGGYGVQGRAMTSQRIQESNDIKRGSLDERRNANASKAGQSFEADPILKQMKNTQYNLGRAQGMLNGSVPLNTKNFALLQQDLINATAPGGTATEGKMNREMVSTFADRLNDLQLKFGNIKDIRQAQPEIVAQLKDLMNEIGQEYKSGMSQQAKDIYDSYQSNSNPKVQETVRTKLQRYAPDEYTKLTGGRAAQSVGGGLIQAPVSAGHPQDSEAVQWAKANPNDARSATILKANGM